MHRERVRAWVMVVWACLAVACEPDRPAEPDSGEPRRDASGSCSEDCGDRLFCNGEERCDPGDPRADENGCVAAEDDPCSGECDEAADRCVTTCTTDDDADGSLSMGCGGDDCDDDDGRRRPGGDEFCDGAALDEDCDPCTVGTIDTDGDGFVASTCVNTYLGATPSCSLDVRVRPGMVVGADCNDADPGVSPGDPEIPCNTVDDDCDGLVDEGARLRFWADRDMDSFGDADATPLEACSLPAGFSDNMLDCDDTRASVNPARGEDCNGFDDNCNGSVDEGFSLTTFHQDADGDGWGIEAVTLAACMQPVGYAPRRGSTWDCDDAEPTVYPGATERCNAVDDNCDGFVNFAISGHGTEDDDRDGYADAQCPGGSGDDCDDTRDTVNPGATDRCNARDDDCDGAVDDGPEADAECGAAPNVVGAGAMCVTGARCSATCASGFADCDGTLTPTNGCEVDVRSSTEHCGACGSVCGAGLVCRSSACDVAPGRQRIAVLDGSEYRGSGADADTCVLRAGSVYCWGIHQPRATLVPGVSAAVEIRRNVVVTSSGRAYRIEGSTDGTFQAQDLGRTDVRFAIAHRGTTTVPWALHVVTTTGALLHVASTTRTITNVGDVVQLASVGDLVCALRRDGSRACWSSHTSATPALTTTAGPFLWLDDRGCALSAAGTISCAGGETTSGYTGATLASTRCAVTGAGTVLCRGTNTQGEVGDGTTTSRPSPVLVSGLSTARQIASGVLFACALDASDAVRCWGSTLYTGSGTSPVRAAVTPPLSGLTDVYDGTFFTTGGRVYTFAAGSATPQDAFTPGTTFAAVGADGFCGVTVGRGLLCRYDDNRGELGNGDPRAHSFDWVTPTGLGSGVARVIGAWSSRVALLDDGRVMRWGAHEYGVTSTGGVDSTSPVLVVSGAQQIVDGGAVACARVSGTLQCWGARVFEPGQYRSSVVSPITIGMIGGAIDAAAHRDGAAAVLAGGSVVTWGRDDFGLRGDGPGTAPFGSVTTLAGLSATRIWGGGGTLCVRRASDGRLLCWGSNAAGQIGDGTTAQRDQPTLVTALPAGADVRELSIGGEGTCALLGDGTARCWGLGDFGVPHTIRALTPTAVVGLP